MPGAGKDLFAKLLRTIPEVDAAEAASLAADGAIIVDVRESDEIAAGTADGAIGLPKGYLELRAEEVLEPLVVLNRPARPDWMTRVKRGEEKSYASYGSYGAGSWSS